MPGPARRALEGALPLGDPRARIHIAPVGFEVERVTHPILEERADRAYLLTRSGDDAARPFVEEVTRRLRAAPRPVEVIVRRAGIWDVFASLGELRRIFEEEQRSDRRAGATVPIRVNVSTGTKITAIAGTLACMLWKGEPYYVQVSESWSCHHTPKLRKVNDVVRRVDPVSVYELRTPAPELVELLEALDRRGGTLRKRELIQELGLDRARAEDPHARTPTAQAQHSRLRHRLDPLEQRWGFVATDRAGARGRVHLTEQGRLALALFGGPGSPPRRVEPYSSD